MERRWNVKTIYDHIGDGLDSIKGRFEETKYVLKQDDVGWYIESDGEIVVGRLGIWAMLWWLNSMKAVPKRRES